MPVISKTLNTNNQQNLQPIGVFDSGVGGLSIFNCIKEQLPSENLIYVADSLYAPYGDKSDKEIIDRVNFIAQELINQNCKALVIACNTATVVAVDQLRERFNIPIIGVEPAIKPAVLNSNNIGILTTQATANNQRFLALVDKYKNSSTVHIQPCPGLVELIENNQLNSTEFDNLLIKFLKNIIDKNIDTLVLGCTHYPFFTDKIKLFLGKRIPIVETAFPVTEQLKRQLVKYQLINPQLDPIENKLQYKFYSSQTNSELASLMSTLVSAPIDLELLAD
jgi:glutamate racemase